MNLAPESVRYRIKEANRNKFVAYSEQSNIEPSEFDKRFNELKELMNSPLPTPSPTTQEDK